MQLTIMLPTNRSGPGAIARIAQACSWASPEIEVIVRDNSGNAKKREQIAYFQGEHCKIIAAEPCEGVENLSEILRLAQGDFVFLIADDDSCFDRAVQSLPAVIDQLGKDPGLIGITGNYAIEHSKASSIFDYADMDSPDVVKRVTGYLRDTAPNVIFYSALRREAVIRNMAFMNSMPIFLSFHDQVLSLLYLLGGRFAKLPRLLYTYDLGIWEFPDSARQRDIDFYNAAGIDPAIDKLHWFLCGFEGAVLVRNSDLIPDYPLAQRQTVADRWFAVMFDRFVRHVRPVPDSNFADEAEQLYAKLIKSTGQLSFQNMLAEICGLIFLFSPDKAQRYFDFWAAEINKRIATPISRSA